MTIALLFSLRWRKEEFDWDLFASTVLHLRWAWLGLAAILALGSYYARAVRWAVMLRPVKPKPNVWGVFSATAIGFTAIVLLGRAGEFVRPYLISLKEKVSFSSQLAAWFIERIFDMLAATLIFGLALTQTARVSLPPDSTLGWVLRTGGYLAGTAAALSLVTLILIQQPSASVTDRLSQSLSFLPAHLHSKLKHLVESFVSGMHCVRSRRHLVALSAYTVLEWGLIACCFLACLRAFPALDGMGIVAALVTLGFVTIGSVVHVPGIGGGFQIMIIVVLTEIYKQPLEVASGLALVIYIMTFVIIVPLGLLLLLAEGLSFRRLRELEMEEVP